MNYAQSNETDLYGTLSLNSPHGGMNSTFEDWLIAIKDIFEDIIDRFGNNSNNNNNTNRNNNRNSNEKNSNKYNYDNHSNDEYRYIAQLVQNEDEMHEIFLQMSGGYQFINITHHADIIGQIRLNRVEYFLFIIVLVCTIHDGVVPECVFDRFLRVF